MPRHTSLTATAVNRLWRATRVPQNYRRGFIVAQGPQASSHSVLAARDAVAAPQNGRKAAMLCSARVGVISRARFAAARAFQSSDMISRDLRNAPLAALGQE